MQGVTFVLTGDKELDRKFKELPVRIEKKVLRESLRPAAKIILAEAKQNAPVLSGQTKKSLRVRAAKRSRKHKTRVTLQVVTGKEFYSGETFYGAFEEFGHKIGPRNRGAERPTYTGSHFIERAYKTKKKEAKADALQRIKEGIEREAAKNA